MGCFIGIPNAAVSWPWAYCALTDHHLTVARGYCINTSAWVSRCSFDVIGQCEGLKLWNGQQVRISTLFLYSHIDTFNSCRHWEVSRRTNTNDMKTTPPHTGKTTTKAYIIAAALLNIGAFFVLPVYDDWYYLSAPTDELNIDKLLPDAVFWRPIDAVFGYLTGLWVQSFPFFHHLIVVTGYLFSVWGLARITDKCCISGFAKFLSMSLFICSPMLVATTYSVDSANQALSLVFGVASLLAYEKRKTLAYACMILSLFSKESGIVWLAVTPALSLWVINGKDEGESGQPARLSAAELWNTYRTPLLIIAAYFALRAMLATADFNSLEPESRYASFSISNIFKGIVLLLGGSLSCIDTIALFLEKDYTVTLLTAIVSLLFLYITGKKLKISRHKWKALVLAVCILAVSSPHLIMSHPAEMHAYPTLWMIAFALGILLDGSEWKRQERIAAYLFLATSLCVFVHKGWYIFQNGLHASKRVKTAVAGTNFIPKHISVIDLDKQRAIYSVFSTTPERSWAMATGTRMYFDFKNPEHIDYRCATPSQKESILQEVLSAGKDIDCIWIVENDSVTVLDVRTKNKIQSQQQPSH